MLGWSFIFLVFHVHYFSNCNAQITIPIDDRQFEIRNSYEFLKLPVHIYTSACKMLAVQNSYCGKFIPEQSVQYLSTDTYHFNGNISVQNTLTVNYKPQNLTNELIFVNNLTQTLKKGFNLDREISDHFNSRLQNHSAILNIANNRLYLMGVLFSINDIGQFIYVNALVTNSTSEWSVRDKKDKTKSELFQVQEYFVTKTENYLKLNVTSKFDIIVNNINLYQYYTGISISIKHGQVFRYQKCKPPDYSNLISTVSALTLLGILIYLIAKNLRPPQTIIEMKILNDDALKLKAEEFFEKYPIGSIESRELEKVTALLPQTMVDHVLAISMIPPREIADFDCFGDMFPVVEIGEIDDQSGSQMVTFTGGVECNVQCNSALVPRLLDTSIHNDSLENDQLPPPAFNSIGSRDAPLECFYQVGIVTLEENKPNLAIGFVTGLYPPFRLPGLCDKSIAFHCQDSTVRFCGETVLFPEIEIYEGDILGIGYYLQPPTEIDTNPDSTLKNVHFYFTFEKKRYEREFILENMDTTLIQPSIGSRSGCEVEVVFGPLFTSFSPENVS